MKLGKSYLLSKIERFTQHTTGNFGDESLQVITCTGSLVLTTKLI